MRLHNPGHSLIEAVGETTTGGAVAVGTVDLVQIGVVNQLTKAETLVHPTNRVATMPAHRQARNHQKNALLAVE